MSLVGHIYIITAFILRALLAKQGCSQKPFVILKLCFYYNELPKNYTTKLETINDKPPVNRQL